MDIIERSIPLALTQVLLPLMEDRLLEIGDSSTIQIRKKMLNDKYGIYFVNVLKENSGAKTVMIKRTNYTYIYSYSPSTNELILKGERKNVNPKT